MIVLEILIMARTSANRMRRLNRMRGANPFMRSGTARAAGDWVISSQGLSNSGALTTVAGWGTKFVLTDALPQSILLVALPTAAAATGQPTIGHVTINQVHGKVVFCDGNTANPYSMVVAIYVAELNSSATAWSVRDPNTAADANRDDYLYLDTMWASIPPSGATITTVASVEFRVSLPRPVQIGGGQGLCLTASLATPFAAGGTAQVMSNVRSHVTRAT
jgi:hypothetical protein